jgi:formate dehydrogenase
MAPDSVFEHELPDAEIVISQPFWPAYLTGATRGSEQAA